MPSPQGLPTREQIIEFISTSDQPAGKRELARAFGLHGADKVALKALLKDMADEGLIDASPGRAFHKLGGVPKVTVLRVVDSDGDSVFAVPERWEADAPPPRLRVIERRSAKASALGIGDRILARTEERGNGTVALPMKRLARGEELMLGVVRKDDGGHFLKPVDKRERRETMISDLGGAVDGDLVLAEKSGRPPRITARVTQVLGDPFAPRSFSLIAIHKHGIPHVFGEEVIAEAHEVSRLPPVPSTVRPELVEGSSLFDADEGKDGASTSSAQAGLGVGSNKREDLRHLPIVAIDPADARDHDDAVWAAPNDAGGYDAIVAIADVSFYVRPGSALDREARKRGNSTYFPDRVVPMLPEELSAEICSLKSGQDRAALVAHMTIGANGKVSDWRFARAVIRVAENIAYEEAQRRIDAGEAEEHLKQLWGAWALLAKARDAREPLELDLPERRVQIDADGAVTSVAVRERLDAHRLIEDFMIAANVAAAKALEAKKSPVMYRVHEVPSREKLVALKDYLETFGVKFALGQVIRPATFNRLLELVGDADYRPQVMEQILRTQTQAYYGPGNMGHFGLSLGSYAHFTSPIRRYADLIVHRALVRSFGLGEGGLTEGEAEGMERIGEAISASERRSMEAERETVDRYVAAYLSQHIGEVMEARITGVANFGFFATVEGIGGDGLVPVSQLGDDYYRYDEAGRTLTGDASGRVFASGQVLPLRLAEANPVSGALMFELPEQPAGRRAPLRDGKRVIHRRGRPANMRHEGRRRR